MLFYMHSQTFVQFLTSLHCSDMFLVVILFFPNLSHSSPSLPTLSWFSQFVCAHGLCILCRAPCLRSFIVVQFHGNAYVHGHVCACACVCVSFRVPSARLRCHFGEPLVWAPRLGFGRLDLAGQRSLDAQCEGRGERER